MTTRVLHVIDAESAGWPAVRALSSFCDSEGRGGLDRVLLVGGSGAETAARVAGLGAPDRLTAPSGVPELAWRSLRGLLRRRSAPALIHAWSPASLALVRLAAPNQRTVATIASPPGRSSIRRALHLRAVTGAGRVIFTSRWIMNAWMASGACMDRAAVHPLPIVRGRTDRGHRREWGVEADAAVLCACGDQRRLIGSKWFSHLAGVATVAGRPVALVLPRGAAQLERAIRHAEWHRHVWKIIVEDQPFWDVAASCDVGVWGGPSSVGLTEAPPWRVPGVHSVALGAAEGLPMVVEDHPAAREALLEDATPAWFAPGRPRDLLAGTLHFLDDLAAARERVRPLSQRLLEQGNPAVWHAAIEREHALALGMTATARAIDPPISVPGRSRSAPTGAS